jgi:DNA-binding NarL/FixJ family response regulator
MAIPRVLVADDHTIVAQGLELLLKDSFNFVGTVTDGRALLEADARLKPDVIVADISMPLLNGLDATRQLRSNGSKAKVVILTMHADPHLASEAFRAGASAFLLKQSAGEELVNAIHEILQGRAYLTPLIAKDMITVLMDGKGQPGSEVKLTPRQREVLQLIAEGRTMKEVAAILNISSRTAETHKYEIMEVLSVRTTAELTQCAIRMRLISLE